jgi:hypothetical protein
MVLSKQEKSIPTVTAFRILTPLSQPLATLIRMQTKNLHRKRASPATSPLLQQTNFKDQGSKKDEGQDKPDFQER